METQKDKPVEYDSTRRMKYHPDFHANNGNPWSEEELEYLCKYGDYDNLNTISLALERTYGTVAQKKKILKADGLYDYYKNLNKHW